MLTLFKAVIWYLVGCHSPLPVRSTVWNERASDMGAGGPPAVETWARARTGGASRMNQMFIESNISSLCFCKQRGWAGEVSAWNAFVFVATCIYTNLEHNVYYIVCFLCA